MTVPDQIQIDAATVPALGLDRRFIGVRPDTVADAIADDPKFGAVSRSAADLLAALTGVIEMETGALRRELDRLYVPHNPDRDTVATGHAEADPERFRRIIGYTFQKANFLRLEDVDVDEAMKAASGSGLKVKLDPEGVESLDLFVRGRAFTQRRRRLWRSPLRGRIEQVEVYRRLGVVVRPKEGDQLLLRLYRDIPVVDIEALLPHATVAMTWWDRCKVAAGGAGALGGIGTKVVTGGLLLSPSTLAIPAAVAFGGLGVKSFLGYRRARHSRVSQRTHHLYNLSLASNAAVLHVLLAMVAAEEINEALLLYATLASPEPAAPKTSIESWLKDRFGVVVDFEIDDAMETLDRLELWADRDLMRVIDPSTACANLRRRLSEREGRAYHLDLIRS